MKTRILLLLPILFFVIACRNFSSYDDHNDALPIAISRFDKDLVRYTMGNDSTYNKHFSQVYSDLLPIYSRYILGLSGDNSEDNKRGLQVFVNDTTIRKLYHAVDSVFPQLYNSEKQLGVIFSRYKQQFDSHISKKISVHVSGYNPIILVTDSMISVPLDNYLGASFKGYDTVFYQYQRKNKEPERLLPDIMRVILYAQYPETSKANKRLLDRIVYQGQILYALHELIPELSDPQLLGYTTQEWDWSVKNEEQIWRKIISDNYLFSTETMLGSKFIEPAPFTAPISQDSPGCLGRFIGYRLVSSYMSNNPGTTLKHLLQNREGTDTILKKSKYKG